ncbi:glycosyltransferase family 4 protein [Christiangramia salexigens]|uniref:Glycosyl transferase family 1 n=1 Tax=Christiangramia salexigens TaxID=1913577 RepID=A0A1L3J8E9_9FLAO|nr:glycosyltransferase family 4 protein [Christiangramia salexigens]APG61395.1 glycosyl transferase family 1 [Christiangramia salexigens]
MKYILYIGNKLEKHGASPTGVDTLPAHLMQEGYQVKAVSSFQNKFLRLADMLINIIRHSRSTELILIDTYSTSNFWYAVLCGYTSKFLNLPFIFILHGGNLEERFLNSDERILDLFRSARKNIVPSEFLKNRLHKFKFNNLVSIPNAIDLHLYPYKERKNVKPRILWVRAFDEVYRPELAIQVLEVLIRDNLDAELCMVGPEKNTDLQSLKILVREKDLPVRFCGKLSKTEWVDLSEEYDIFLNTTSIDNTPVSVIEAMALGMPVVSTNVGGIPYLIEDKTTGLLVERDEPEVMAAAIKLLVEQPELSHLISENSRAKAESFAWDKVKVLWRELLV